MAEFDEDEAQGAPPESSESASDGDKLQAKLSQLEKDNYKLRAKVRKAEFVEEYGKDVAELIPSSLSADEAKDLAEKLKGKFPVATPETETAKVEEPEAVEATPPGLAAVAKGSVPGGAAPETLMTPKEIKELAKTNPEEANRLIWEGRFAKVGAQDGSGWSA